MGSPLGKLDPEVVAELYAAYAEELTRFVLGVLRDPQLTQDVLQTAFSRLVEQGEGVQQTAHKAWLFRVAYHEAMLVRRREQIHQRALRRLVGDSSQEVPAELALVRHETVDRVRAALEELPAAQREVLQKRLYEDQTFATIARELNIPLGTVLSRMQAALKKLRERLGRETS